MNDPQSEGHMASYIGRRKFLASLSGAAAAWPLAARAQQPGSTRRIGVLMNLSSDDPEAQTRIGAFLQGLQNSAGPSDVPCGSSIAGAPTRIAFASPRRSWSRSHR